MQQTWVWHKPSWRRSPITHHRGTRTYTRLGKQTPGGHKQNLVHQDPGERSSEPQRDGPRLAHEYPGVSSGFVGQWWPAAGLGAQSTAVHAWDPLKGTTIIFITSTIVWPQVNNRKGTQPHPSTENWIKDLLSKAHPQFIRQTIRSNPLNLFSLPLYSHTGFDAYLNGSVVFPTFFKFSLNLAIRSS